MSEKYLDVAKESSIQEVLSKIEEGSGLYVNPTKGITTKYVCYESGQTSTDEGTSVVNCNGTIYFISDNSNMLRKYQDNTLYGIENVAELPYVIDVHETSMIVFNNEIHLLGGDDELLRTHYKWDGESWKIASELPFDFCDGLAIVYNNEIHIIGSCPTGFHVEPESVKNVFINSHYKWDGETWKKASELPYLTWGCTGFVMNSKLHICGGGRGEGVSYTKNHYIWDGISWSKASDLPDERFSASAVRISDNEVYITGGINPAVNRKIASTLKYDGIGFYTGPSVENDGQVNSGYGVTYNNNLQPVILGRRYYTLVNNSWKVSYSFGDFDNGSVIEVNGEIHVFNNTDHFMLSNKTHGEFISLEPNKYPIHQTAVMYYNDRIHIFGSSDDAYADYHCTWDEKNGWVVKSNLPDKLVNGTVVEFNGEIHIIGGKEMNKKTFNHYKLFNNRWVPVAKTPCDIIGTRSAVVYNNCIYAVGYRDDLAKTYLLKYNGTAWSTITSWTTEWNAHTPYTIIHKNRLHVLEYSEVNEKISNKVFTTNNNGNVTENSFEWMDNKPGMDASKIPYVTNIMGSIGIIAAATPYRGNIYRIGYTPNEIKSINVWLPRNHTFICDKSKFIPIIGEMEEVKNGFRTLSTTKYSIGYIDDDEPYTIC